MEKGDKMQLVEMFSESGEGREEKGWKEQEVFDLIMQEDWRQVIRVLTQDMDPWNIDLVELNSRLTSYITQMKHLDLKVPAKILLAAAIIYRLKSELIVYEEKEESKEEGEVFDLDSMPLFDPSQLEGMGGVEEELDIRKISLPPIRLPSKKKIKRRVSLDELIVALDKALKIKKRSQVKEFFQIDLNHYDITTHIEEIYEMILNFLESKEVISFSHLLPTRHSVEDKLRTFQSLLHLTTEERIKCWQEKMFGEIHISKYEEGQEG